MAINGLNPLAYVGVNSPNPSAQIITSDADPTPNDSLNVTIGDIWINQNVTVLADQHVFMLTALIQGVATWTEIGTTGNVLDVVGGTNITVNTVADTATVNLNPSVVLAGSLTAGTGVSVTNGSVSINNINNNGTASAVSLSKSRAGAAVQSGDQLGSDTYVGFDGTAFQVSAAIQVNTTGTIAAGRVPSEMTFYTTPDAVSAPIDRMVIDENGTVTINATTGGNASLIVNDLIEVIDSGIQLENSQVNAAADSIVFLKDRAHAVIVTGDTLGSIGFSGFDGAAFQESAVIDVVSTGVIGAGRIPSVMSFSTTPAAGGAPVERMFIDQNGTVNINAADLGNVGLLSRNDVESTLGYSLGRTVSATGDLGFSGVTHTSFTNVVVPNAAGGGKLTIDSQSANPGVQAGFIKIYVGATIAYIPYFTSISP